MVREYIFLAAGCVSVGVLITFIVLGIAQHLGINIEKNIWVAAIPVVLTLFLNVILLEVYRRYKKRK